MSSIATAQLDRIFVLQSKELTHENDLEGKSAFTKVIPSSTTSDNIINLESTPKKHKVEVLINNKLYDITSLKQ